SPPHLERRGRDGVGCCRKLAKGCLPCDAFFSLQLSPLLSTHQRRPPRRRAIACKGPAGAIPATASSQPLPNSWSLHPAQTPVGASIRDMRTGRAPEPTEGVRSEWAPVRSTAALWAPLQAAGTVLEAGWSAGRITVSTDGLVRHGGGVTVLTYH